MVFRVGYVIRPTSHQTSDFHFPSSRGTFSPLTHLFNIYKKAHSSCPFWSDSIGLWMRPLLKRAEAPTDPPSPWTRYLIRTPSINDHLCTGRFRHRFGIQPSVSSSFLLTLAHVATQSNDSETFSSSKLQNPRYVSDLNLPLELPGL